MDVPTEDEVTGGQHESGEHPDNATSSATDDSSVGFGNRLDDEDDDETSEPSMQDAHNPETDEDTSSGGPAD